MYEDTRKELLSQANFRDGRVLEIGCGPGRVTAMYAGETTQTIGIEPEHPAAARAAALVQGASFVCASGMDLPFRAGTFDIILYTLSLHHHPNIRMALREARNMLAQGGRILVLEPTIESEIQQLCKPFEDEDHCLEAVESALPGCGMETVSRRKFRTQWEFTGFEDVERYAFTYYAHPQDPEKQQAMRAFLGPKAEDRPLRMTDTLRLTCLRG